MEEKKKVSFHTFIWKNNALGCTWEWPLLHLSINSMTTTTLFSSQLLRFRYQLVVPRAGSFLHSTGTSISVSSDSWKLSALAAEQVTVCSVTLSHFSFTFSWVWQHGFGSQKMGFYNWENYSKQEAKEIFSFKSTIHLVHVHTTTLIQENKS